MADRTKVELFITFESGRSSPIVLLNLRARNRGFATCSQGHCRCLLQQVLLEREQDAGERKFTIQKDIAKTCSYSSPQLNFSIYCMKDLHRKWFDLAEGKLSIFIFLSWMAGRKYSTDHSWFSSRRAATVLLVCKPVNFSWKCCLHSCFLLRDSKIPVHRLSLYSYVVLVCCVFFFLWGAFKTAAFACFAGPFSIIEHTGVQEDIAQQINQSKRAILPEVALDIW